jgi:high-affinity iron transporter
MTQTARVIRALIVLFVIVTITNAGATRVHAKGKLTPKNLIEETGTYLNEALALYKKGDISEAKLKAQAAYFEVYENLEGPIRVNVSAKKNYELEEEFVAIRKMIVNKEPADALEKRINDFMTQLRAVLPHLEGGVELVAEPSPERQEHVAATRSNGIEPVWQQAVDRIQAGMGNALDLYKKGDRNKAAELVVQTQFEDYKNSLFETAVRRYVSQKEDYQNNSRFSEIAGMISRGEAPEKVETEIAGLINGLKEDLPGLPLVEGAELKRDAAKNETQEAGQKDWSAVTAELFSELDKAVVLYETGDAKGAVTAVQDAYFDVFEASGMEAKIGSRDAAFKGTLESHFNMIVGSMKSGASADKLQGVLGAMRADFDRAEEMLGKGKDSPTALFFYSLMIILREGIEAILIITAIIAYLVKTGNEDKLKVIYNGVLAALGLSIATAVLVKWVFKTSAASQEVLEGATMLLAAVVLFSVSYWLISKAEAQKWVAYIKDKVGSSLSASSLKALWFAAFLAVYREGAETVLFYQALASDAPASGVTAVAAGFVLGSILLIGIYLAMRFGAVKLPIRPFFLFTGALLYYMAFVFAGKGVMELISGKIFEPTLVSWIPTVEFIGMYPYVQTLIPQFAIIAAAAAGLVVMARQRASAVKATADK